MGYRLRQELRLIIKQAKDRKCLDCKGTYPPSSMSFDHVPERGEKLFNIGGSLVGVTKKQLLAELLKCDAVCIPCHRDREYLRMAGFDVGTS